MCCEPGGRPRGSWHCRTGRGANLLAQVAKWLVELSLKNRRLNAYLGRRYTHPFIRSPQYRFAPPGHYYSPLPGPRDVEEYAQGLNSCLHESDPSVDLNDRGQEELLHAFAPLYREFDWADHPVEGRRFILGNHYFDHGDAIALYCMLRYFVPRRVIEVGSGYSSALMLDTSERFLGRAVHFTFIEPDPVRLLALATDYDKMSYELVARKVQDVPLGSFDRLQPNDFLFIDSSHVTKAGSDVNYLMFKVLPRLKPGVIVHIHDVFWPFEYPLEWLREGRAWNETYLVRAFLQYNSAFKVLLFNDYVGKRFHGLLTELMPLFMINTGGSLWLRRV